MWRHRFKYGVAFLAFLLFMAIAFSSFQEGYPSFRLIWEDWKVVRNAAAYSNVREIDFNNWTYELGGGSSPFVVELHNGTDSSAIPFESYTVTLKSVHYCGQTAVVELDATFAGGSSINTSHVRLFRLLLEQGEGSRQLVKTGIDYGWVRGKELEVDCEQMRLTMYSGDDELMRDEMFVGQYDLERFELKTVESRPIRTDER